MVIIKVGEKAPDFVLKDQNEKEFNLKDFRGKKVLLSFHPLAWTSVCAKQMQSLENNKERLSKLNTDAVGVNVDPIPSKKAWAKELGIENTRLLSDFWSHGAVAKKFGIFREKEGFSERANIIIDENGKAIFTKVYDLPELPDIEEIIEFLQK
jgi:peroxiredoxin